MTDETETTIELQLEIRAQGDSGDDAVQSFLDNSESVEASIWRPKEQPEGPDAEGFYRFVCKAEVLAGDFGAAVAKISDSSEDVPAEITVLEV